MSRSSRFSLCLLGGLLFLVGVVVGQRTQRSKFDKYLEPQNVTGMRLALIDA